MVALTRNDVRTASGINVLLGSELHVLANASILRVPLSRGDDERHAAQ